MINCNKVPFTGRKQLKLLPEGMLLSMGVDNYRQFLATHQVVNGTADADMVKRTGGRIAQSTEKLLTQVGQKEMADKFAWEFNLVKDPAANAWCMPGGKVVFYTGILPITLDENGMAVVMGHEIAHAVARHGNERMSQALAVTVGFAALDVALREKPEQTRNLFLAAYGLGATVGVMLPFSRKHESEADEIGLYLMAAAGYDPREAPKFWERMARLSPSQVPEFLSTHPSHETRIKDINEKYMPRALRYHRQSKTLP
jgi:predicted Zn-dependent protease